MSLFTGKGDDGTTSAFKCDQRFSKSSEIAEALGALDELNSYLGFLKLSSEKEPKAEICSRKFSDLITEVQQNLFIIQAEVAGAGKRISTDKVKAMSDLINEIEKELPSIKTFFVSGGTELSSQFDFARTIARRAERRVVGSIKTEGVDLDDVVGPDTLAYLNRLSSLLYALARLSNHISGIKEESPNYK